MLRHCFAIFLAALACVAHAMAQPYGLTTRPAFSAFNNNVFPPNASTITGSWSAVPVWPSLTFSNPLGILQEPGTQSMIVWEREGRVYRFDRATGANKTLILDLSAHTQGWDDCGLLNLISHPNYASNGYVFIYYNWVPSTASIRGNSTTRPPTFMTNWKRLSRFTRLPNGTLDPASETVLMHQKSESLWHSGSGMFFHPSDGFLYFINGDDFVPSKAQTFSKGLFSGIFRIDVDQRGGTISNPIPRQPLPAPNDNTGSYTANYFIPNDNPLVGQTGVLEEYIALGVRSPHRLTYDAVTGRMFHSDVGDASREEINAFEPGEVMPNYQWPKFEGLVGDLTAPYLGLNKKPMLDYTHADGSAVIGGYVYRGNEFPELKGKYIFGDNMNGTLWYLDESTTPASKIAICKLPNGPGNNSGDNYLGLSSFALDADGELLMTQLSNSGGRIYKLSRTGGNTNTLPATLSATNIFSDLSTLTTNEGFIAYDVNTPLWSDNAQKQRWFAVPSGQRIGYAPTGEWSFPTGSVFVKHFELNTDETNPSLMRRLETRVLVRDNQGFVYGATYKWRTDLSDADLINDSQTENITITTASGTRTQPWLFPGRQSCLACHTPASKGVLGLNTPQNHRDHLFTETAVTDNQLRAWNHVSYFTPSIDESSLSSLQSFASLDSNSASLETRARSYLDSNCSHCHRPGGTSHALWDARFETPLASAGIINGAALNDLGTPGSRVIMPQDLVASVLHKRLATASQSYAMPPIAKALVDAPAVALLEQWINSLTPPTWAGIAAPWVGKTFAASTAATGSASVLGPALRIRHTSGSPATGTLPEPPSFFVGQTVSGNGAVMIKLVSHQQTLDGNPIPITTGSIGLGVRASLNEGAVRSYLGSPSPGHWMLLQRNGNNVTGYYSDDGIAWTTGSTFAATLPTASLLGVYYTFVGPNSTTPGYAGEAVFEDVRIMPLVPWAYSAHPRGQLVRVGDLVEFGVETVGLKPTSYQWRKNNTSISRAVSSRYAFKAALTSAGSYSVLTGGKMLSNAANLVVLDKVTYTNNLAPNATATFTLSYAGTGASFVWTKDGVPLQNSTRILGATSNKLTVKALTLADIGDYECVVTGFGTTQVLGPYHLHVLSKPTITAPAPTAWSVSRSGFSWQLTADEPASSYVVTGLPSGVTYNSTTGLISGTPNVGNSSGFTINVYARNAAGSGATRSYTFVVDPFPTPLIGGSAGLVDRSTVNNDLGGLITLNITTTGSVTGRITLGASSYSLSSRAVFISGTDPTVTFPAFGSPSKLLTLTLNATTGVITGNVNGTLVNARHLVRTSPASYAGNFNTQLKLPSGDVGISSKPQGTGWTRAVVNTSATVTFSGRLSDNTSLTGSATVRDDGSVAWHQMLYGNKGSVQGTPSFAGSTFAGTLSWRKIDKASSTDRTYASGFALTDLIVEGEKFVPIPSGSTFLGLTSAKIEFTEGGISAAAVTNKPNQNFTLTTAHKALFSTDYLNVNPCYDTLTITSSTGFFSGTVKLKDGSLTRTFTYQGLFLNGRSEALGAFVLLQLPGTSTSPYLSGAIRIAAQ